MAPDEEHREHGQPALAWAEHVAALDQRLARAFEALARALELSPDELAFRPAPERWSALEVVEHVTLTNHFLGKLVGKIARRSAARARAGERPAAAPARVEHLRALGERALAWRHPVHMTPTGAARVAELAARLAAQAARTRELLALLPRGEGTLHTIRMSAVPGTDQRLDLYQFLEVIALHAERHARQIERNRAAWREAGGA